MFPRTRERVLWFVADCRLKPNHTNESGTGEVGVHGRDLGEVGAREDAWSVNRMVWRMQVAR